MPNPSARVAAMAAVFIFGTPSLLLITTDIQVSASRVVPSRLAPRRDVAETGRLSEVAPIAPAAAGRAADEMLGVALGRGCALLPAPVHGARMERPRGGVASPGPW